MDRPHDAFGVVGSCNRQDFRVCRLNDSLLRSQTSRHHDLSVFFQSLTNRAERFFDRGVDEAAGVDDDEVGAGVVGRGGVALGAKLREDALGVDERFRTA